MFYLILRETEREKGRGRERQRDRETQNLRQAPGSELSGQNLTQGSISWTARS